MTYWNQLTALGWVGVKVSAGALASEYAGRVVERALWDTKWDKWAHLVPAAALIAASPLIAKHVDRAAGTGVAVNAILHAASGVFPQLDASYASYTTP